MTCQSTATWTNSGGQSVVLSQPEHAHLSDHELVAVAREEADRIGLDLGDDLIITSVLVG